MARSVEGGAFSDVQWGRRRWHINVMNQKYWNDLADQFDTKVFEIVANETSGNLARCIEILGKKHHTAGDFGCGAGGATRLLAAHFDRVVAVDFAEKLLTEARKRVTAKHVRFIKSDLCKEVDLPFKVGASFCFNAMIHPSATKREQIARSVFRNTKRRGAAVFVVPSLESYLRTFQTLIECRVGQGHKRGTTTRSVSRSADREIQSLVEGICSVGGVATKYFMQDEVSQLLSKVGFKVTAIDRVEFPWSEELDYLPETLGPPYPWDWMVTARK